MYFILFNLLISNNIDWLKYLKIDYTDYMTKFANKVN